MTKNKYDSIEPIRRAFEHTELPEEFSSTRALGDIPFSHWPPMPWKPAAVLVPLVDRRAGLTILLTRRTEHLLDHAGQVSFPGGSREPGDSGPVQTALRETHEEIGLDPQHVETLGFLDGYLTISGYAVTPVVGVVKPDIDLHPDPLEVAEVFEVPLTFLRDPDNRQVRAREVDGHTVGYYLFKYRQYVIWGATAGMLVNFLNKLELAETR